MLRTSAAAHARVRGVRGRDVRVRARVRAHRAVAARVRVGAAPGRRRKVPRVVCCSLQPRAAAARGLGVASRRVVVRVRVRRVCGRARARACDRAGGRVCVRLLQRACVCAACPAQPLVAALSFSRLRIAAARFRSVSVRLDMCARPGQETHNHTHKAVVDVARGVVCVAAAPETHALCNLHTYTLFVSVFVLALVLVLLDIV